MSISRVDCSGDRIRVYRGATLVSNLNITTLRNASTSDKDLEDRTNAALLSAFTTGRMAQVVRVHVVSRDPLEYTVAVFASPADVYAEWWVQEEESPAPVRAEGSER